MLDSKASDLDKEERPEVVIFVCVYGLMLIVCFYQKLEFDEK